MTQLQIVKSLARLQCTECGAEANASCNCGKPYLPKEIAKEAIRANPQRSNRAIAEETGVSEPTVRRARASGDAPETVVGLDGKTYKAKGKAPLVTVSATQCSDYDDDDIAESDPDVIEEEEIAEPEQIEGNIIYCLERVNAHVPMFKKHIKLSTFDREAKERISAAFDQTIKKLRSVQSVLAKNGGGE
jgi:hypothetical protein